MKRFFSLFAALAALVSVPVFAQQSEGNGTVSISGPITIGTLPALPAGSNTIGGVTISGTPTFNIGTMPGVAGAQSNAGSNMAATSANIGSNGYLYGWDGTLWEPLLVCTPNTNTLCITDATVNASIQSLGTLISAPDSRPASSTITVADAGSTSTAGFQNVAIYSGTPTASSFVGIKPSTSSVVMVQVSGTWSGTLQFEEAIDNASTGGSNWEAVSCMVRGYSAPSATTTGNGIFECATAGVTGVRTRATAWSSGTATVQYTVTPQTSPRNPHPMRLTDGAADSFALTGGSAAINISTATTTQLVALASGKAIYVTAMDVVAGGTGNITFEYGTGTNCGTGTTVLTGAYNLVAQSGLAKGNGAGAVWIVPAGNALCALTSAAVQMSGSVSYAQF